MVAVPGMIPVATPVPDMIVATVGVPLLHVPPGVALLNVVLPLWHTLSKPVMAAGVGNTVNTSVTIQLAGVV